MFYHEKIFLLKHYLLLTVILLQHIKAEAVLIVRKIPCKDILLEGDIAWDN